jgi:pSer/pThr/pTyr-binding forkhead associated (FHA) protein
MAQVCQMCGEERIDDDLERCPRCHQTLLVSEGLPPVRGKPRIPIQPEPSPKAVEEPQASARPSQEKRHRRPRPQPGEPAPAAGRPQQPPSVESSEFGRMVERYVEHGAKGGKPATPSREVPGPDVEDPFRRPVPPPRARPDAHGRTADRDVPPTPAQPEAHDSRNWGHVAPRPTPRPVTKPLPLIPSVDRDDDPEFGQQSHRIEMTEAPRGLDIRKLNIPTRSYEVELFSAPNNWVPLFQLIGMDKSPGFGRSHKMLDQGMETMAERHVRFKNTMGGVEIEPLESLNGIYLQITRPVVLSNGMRFRIGDYVLEYRDAEPAAPVSPRIADDGELFVAQDIEPLAFIHFVRPDDQPGVQFPILKSTSTVLGRGGTDQSGAPRHVDIPLLNDKLVSGRHAEIRRANDHFVLEDLKSKNGTFVRINEKTLVGDGATLCLGKVYLRVVQIKSFQAR